MCPECVFLPLTPPGHPTVHGLQFWPSSDHSGKDYQVPLPPAGARRSTVLATQPILLFKLDPFKGGLPSLGSQAIPRECELARAGGCSQAVS
jgi:hypothetical protein